MILSIIYFLPCLISLMWAVTFSFKVKTERQTLFMWTKIVSVVYYVAYALYIHPEADYGSMVRVDAISSFTTLTLLAMNLVFIYMHYDNNFHLSLSQLFLLTPAIIVGTAVNLLYFIVGFDAAASMTESMDKIGILPVGSNQELWKIYYLFDNDVFNLSCLIFEIIILLFCIKILRKDGYKPGFVYKFFFKKNTSTPSRVIAVLSIATTLSIIPLLVMGRNYIISHPLLGVVTTLSLATMLHLTAHVEFFSDSRHTVTLYDLSHIDQDKKPKQEEDNDGLNVQDITEDTATETDDSTHRVIKRDLLAEKVINMLEKEEAFRNDDLSMASLSEMTGIGRTTLSQIISDHYGVPFRDVVNKLRIDAVKKLIIDNPAITQEVLACECGFKDASSLNRKFKEMEGDTPLVWRSHQSKQAEA